MTFYLTFLAFYFVHRFAALMWVWGGAVVLLNGLPIIGPTAPSLLAHLFNYLILEFLAGMAMAYLFVSDRVPDWRIGVAVSGLLLVIFVAAPNTHRVFVGLALAPLVLLTADWERRRRPELPKAAVVIGAASYAIYLVHDPAIAVAARLLKFVHSWPAMFVLLALVGVITGLLYHFGFEKRALRLASRGKVGARLQRHGVA